MVGVVLLFLIMANLNQNRLSGGTSIAYVQPDIL
jgi:hypothetical protein